MKVYLVFILVLCQRFSYELKTEDAKLLTDTFGEQNFGEVKVNNDVWGKDAGPQQIIASSGSNWCAQCSHGNTGGIKSYPHSTKIVKKTLQSLAKISSTFGGKVDAKEAGVLAYALSYDIWCQNNKYETMLWMKYEGQVGPLGSVAHPKQKIGDFNWKIYKGTNGANHVLTFVNLASAFSGTVDIKAILEFEVQQGWVKEKGAAILDDIQFGYEITSTPPNASLCVTALSVSLG